MSHVPHPPIHRHSQSKLAVVLCIIPLLVLIILSAFAWPPARLGPQDLALGLVAPEPAVAQLSPTLSHHGFEISVYEDEDSARAAMRDRDIYGAIIITPDSTTLLTSSAASPVVAQLLQQIGTQLVSDSNQGPLKVIDVIPTASGDSRGSVLGASMMPLVLAGIITAVLMSQATKPGWLQISGLVTAAIVIGITVNLVVQTWLDALDGDWWLNAGVFGLMSLALASTGAGAYAIWGKAGLGGVAVLMILIGNPFSAITSAPELLPKWVGITGQLLPPGATGTLIRSTAFFDGANGLQPLIVLLAWASCGLGAILVGRELDQNLGTLR